MKTTVLVESKTRDNLRQVGTKGETYDQIISNLLLLRMKVDRASPDSRFEPLLSEATNP